MTKKQQGRSKVEETEVEREGGGKREKMYDGLVSRQRKCSATNLLRWTRDRGVMEGRDILPVDRNPEAERVSVILDLL